MVEIKLEDEVKDNMAMRPFSGWMDCQAVKKAFDEFNYPLHDINYCKGCRFYKQLRAGMIEPDMACDWIMEIMRAIYPKYKLELHSISLVKDPPNPHATFKESDITTKDKAEEKAERRIKGTLLEYIKMDCDCYVSRIDRTLYPLKECKKHGDLLSGTIKCLPKDEYEELMQKERLCTFKNAHPQSQNLHDPELERWKKDMVKSINKVPRITKRSCISCGTILVPTINEEKELDGNWTCPNEKCPRGWLLTACFNVIEQEFRPIEHRILTESELNMVRDNVNARAHIIIPKKRILAYVDWCNTCHYETACNQNIEQKLFCIQSSLKVEAPKLWIHNSFPDTNTADNPVHIELPKEERDLEGEYGDMQYKAEPENRGPGPDEEEDP